MTTSTATAISGPLQNPENPESNVVCHYSLRRNWRRLSIVIASKGAATHSPTCEASVISRHYKNEKIACAAGLRAPAASRPVAPRVADLGFPLKESHRVTQHTIRLGMQHSFGVACLVLPTSTKADMERPKIGEPCMERV